MRKFLYLCLLGTTLAGINYAVAKDTSIRSSSNGSSSSASSIPVTPRTNYSAGQNVNDQLDMFETTANLRQNNYSGSQGNIWTDGKGNIIGKTGSDGGWFTDNNGQVVHYRIEGTNAVVTPSSTSSQPSYGSTPGSGYFDASLNNPENQGALRVEISDSVPRNNENVYNFPGVTPGATEPSVQTPGEWIRSQDVSGASTTTTNFDLGDGVHTTVTGPANSPGTYVATTTDTKTGASVTQVVDGGNSQTTQAGGGSSTITYKNGGEVTPAPSPDGGTLSAEAAGATFSRDGIDVGQTNLGDRDVMFLEGSGKELKPAGMDLYTDGTEFYKVEGGQAFKMENVSPTFSNEGIPVGQTNLGDRDVMFLESGGKELTPTSGGLYTDGTNTYKVENGMAYKMENSTVSNPVSSNPTFSNEGIDVGQTNLGDRDVMFLEGSGKELTPTEGGLYTDGTDTYKVEGGKAYKLENQQGDSNAVGQNKQASAQQAGEEKVKAAAEAAKGIIDKAVVQNVGEYALQIMEAMEGQTQDDITKDVTVKATKLQQSQGSPTGPAGDMNASLGGSNLASAAQAMVALLDANQIDMSLLDDDACRGYVPEASVGVGGDSGHKELDRTEEILCIRQRNRLFAHDAAVSAQMIAEGSNAISAQFYDRVSALASSAGGTMGSLGAMSVINDSERYPYFEMVRGTALSAVQLWLKGASTYTQLDAVLSEEE